MSEQNLTIRGVFRSGFVANELSKDHLFSINAKEV